MANQSKLPSKPEFLKCYIKRCGGWRRGETCILCQKPYNHLSHVAIRIAGCDHILGRQCLKDHCQRNANCPICDRKLFLTQDDDENPAEDQGDVEDAVVLEFQSIAPGLPDLAEISFIQTPIPQPADTQLPHYPTLHPDFVLPESVASLIERPVTPLNPEVEDLDRIFQLVEEEKLERRREEQRVKRPGFVGDFLSGGVEI